MFIIVPRYCKFFYSSTYKNICQELHGTKEQKDIEKVFGFPLQGCIVPKFSLSTIVYDIAVPELGAVVGFFAGVSCESSCPYFLIS